MRLEVVTRETQEMVRRRNRCKSLRKPGGDPPAFHLTDRWSRVGVGAMSYNENDRGEDAAVADTCIGGFGA